VMHRKLATYLSIVLFNTNALLIINRDMGQFHHHKS